MESQETTTATQIGLSIETPGAITNPSPADQPIQQWVDIGKDFLSKMFDYVTDFISDNEKLLINLLLFFLAVVAVRVILAVLAAINDFPLLSPFFELIGLGYTTWFVYRYLWKESSRKELKDEFEVLKSQVMGKHS